MLNSRACVKPAAAASEGGGGVGEKQLADKLFKCSTSVTAFLQRNYRRRGATKLFSEENKTFPPLTPTLGGKGQIATLLRLVVSLSFLSLKKEFFILPFDVSSKRISQQKKKWNENEISPRLPELKGRKKA